jgi:uncharacterized protein YjiS (DUF1127 family)
MRALTRARLRAWLAWLADTRRLRQAIRELETFDDRRLRDVGLTRGDIECAVRLGRPPTTNAAPVSRPRHRAAAA